MSQSILPIVVTKNVVDGVRGNMDANATKLAASNSAWRTARAQIEHEPENAEWLFVVSGVPIRMTRGKEGVDGTEAVARVM